MLLFVERYVFLPGIGLTVQMIDEPVDHLTAEDGLFNDLLAVLRFHMDVHNAKRLNMNQRAHFAKAVAAAHLDVETFFLIGVVFQSHINMQTPLFALGLDVVVDFQGTARNAAGACADQNGGYVLALPQGVFGISLKDVEAVFCQLNHFAASFF